METFFQIITDYIAIWGYIAIVIGMALESACIPVPSEIIFGFAGFLVYSGQLEFTRTVIAGVSGGLLGSVIAYFAGYYGGRPFIEKYGRYVFISRRHIDTAQEWFDRYGIKATFFSRMLPVVRTFISLPAGFAHVHFGKFVVYTLLGSIPWTILLIYAGMLLGENWPRLHELGQTAGVVVVLVLAIAAGYYYIKRRKQPKTK